MSETVTSEPVEAAEAAADAAGEEAPGDGDAHGHGHPTDWAYTKIAVVLAAVTALEVSTYFLDFGPALVPSLMFMMVLKFYLVATWFMHLRFDSRLFAKMFTAGLFLAVGVYVVALAAFEVWA